MDLIRECLDNEVFDRNGERLARVDGIVIAIEDDGQPRVIAIEIGTITQARRVHRRVGRWAERCVRRWGKAGEDPYRIPWRMLTRTGDDYKADVEAAKTPARAWENWLREHVIGRIWGA